MPLLRKAAPQNTGVIFSSSVPLRTASMISGIVTSSPSTNFSSTVSWHSATASTICSRRRLASSISSAGTGPVASIPAARHASTAGRMIRSSSSPNKPPSLAWGP